MKMNPMSPYALACHKGDGTVTWRMLDAWTMFLWVIAAVDESGHVFVGEDIETLAIHWICCPSA